MKNKSIISWLASALATILIPSLLLTGCGAEPEPEETAQEIPAKKIEIFTVGQSQTPLSFTKSGQTESSTYAFVMPQIAGQITDVKVGIGDKVGKNQTLVTLGESLSTDASELNYESALEGLENLGNLKFKTNYSAQKDLQSIMVGYYTAVEGVENAIRTKENAEELYDEQYDALDDTLDELDKNNPTYEGLKAQLDQLELSFEAQEDQLDFAIDMAKTQLQSAILAVEGAQARYSLQFIQLDSSILQAETGAELASLQAKARNIKAPISGTVTNIQAEKGNMTAPGQILLTIENIEELKAKTYISVDEVDFIKLGTLVAVSSTTTSSTGKVTSINPTLSPNGKLEVEIEIGDRQNFFSGEIIDITFTPSTDALSTLVPLNSIVIEDGQHFVNTIASDKTIERKPVTTGRIIDNYIEILDGLNSGTQIAQSNTVFLREGDKIAYKVQR
jgi:RND family efflux transporter MFP subunit